MQCGVNFRWFIPHETRNVVSTLAGHWAHWYWHPSQVLSAGLGPWEPAQLRLPQFHQHHIMYLMQQLIQRCHMMFYIMHHCIPETACHYLVAACIPSALVWSIQLADPYLMLHLQFANLFARLHRLSRGSFYTLTCAIHAVCLNPLDPTTAAAGRSVQSWNGRRRLHTGPSVKKILANNY